MPGISVSKICVPFGGGVSWETYWKTLSLFFLDGTILDVAGTKYFVDKSINGRNFLITGYDFATDWTVGFPYKSAATISAPAADAALIAADINNFLYDAGGTPNAIPVVSLFQDIDYEHVIFCKHEAQVVDGNGVETYEPRVIAVYMATAALTGADLIKAYIDFGVPAESTGNDVRWVMPTGSDLSATGYKTAPWLTVSKAAATVNDGDIVYAKTDDEATVIYDQYNQKIYGIGYRKNTIGNTTYSLRFSSGGGNEWEGIIHIAGTASYCVGNANPALKFKRNYFTGLDNTFWTGPIGELINNIILHGAVAGSSQFRLTGTNAPTISGNVFKATKATGATNVLAIEGAYTGMVIANNKFYPNTTSDVITNLQGIELVTIIGNTFIPTAYRYAYAGTGERAVKFNYNKFTGSQVGTGVVLTNCKTLVNEVKYNVANYIISLVNNSNSSVHAEGNIINSSAAVRSSGGDIYCFVNADGAITACRILYNSIHCNASEKYSILVGSDGYSAAGRDVVADIQIIGNRIVNDNATGCHTVMAAGQKNQITKYNNLLGAGGGIGILGKDSNTDNVTAFIGYNIIKNHANGIYFNRSDGLRVFNNVVINDSNAYGIAARDIGGAEHPTNSVVKNNIVICLGTGTVPMVEMGGAGNAFDYNLYYCPNGTPTFGGTTFALWQAGGQDAHSKILTGGEFAGLFTDFANGDYSLPVGSVAIGYGEDLGANFDDGLDASTNWGSDTAVPVIVTKQQGVAWDCGAYVH